MQVAENERLLAQNQSNSLLPPPMTSGTQSNPPHIKTIYSNSGFYRDHATGAPMPFLPEPSYGSFTAWPNDPRFDAPYALSNGSYHASGSHTTRTPF